MNKKIVKMMAAIGLTLFAAMFTSCKKEQAEKDTRNTFVYDGETYAVAEGVQMFAGRVYPNANGVMLLLKSDEYVLALALLVPTNKDRLVAHNYAQDNTHNPYTVPEGAIGYFDENGEFDPVYEIENIDVDVSISEETYTVNITGTIDGSPLTGNYTGPLQWIDESFGQNNFSRGNYSYPISKAVQLFMGETPANTNGVALMLGDNSNVFVLIFFVPKNKDRLVAHDYEQNNNGTVYTTLDGSICNIDGNGEFEIVYGVENIDATVSLTGETYTINITGISDGLPFTCNYIGTSEWEDGSDQEWPWTAQNHSKTIDIRPLSERFYFKTGIIK
jgi:hypothetical protein